MRPVAFLIFRTKKTHPYGEGFFVAVDCADFGHSSFYKDFLSCFICQARDEAFRYCFFLSLLAQIAFFKTKRIKRAFWSNVLDYADYRFPHISIKKDINVTKSKVISICVINLDGLEINDFGTGG